MKIVTRVALAACALFSASPVIASIDIEVPTANYITFGGADWAWISPCSATSPSCGDTDLFEFQGSLGWRLPTAAEFALRPQASDFGTADSFACATPYFADVHSHCDYGDGEGGFIWNPSDPSSNSNVDTFAIRLAQVAAVPEPATWAMMVIGFGVVGGSMRRKRKAAATLKLA